MTLYRFKHYHIYRKEIFICRKQYSYNQNILSTVHIRIISFNRFVGIIVWLNIGIIIFFLTNSNQPALIDKRVF